MNYKKKWKMLNKLGRTLLWVTSLLFFILGVWYPLMSTSAELIGITLSQTNIRLLDSVKLFYKEGELLIAGLIFVFAFLLPIAKYIEIGVRLVKPEAISDRLNVILHKLDKWSMLDVFLVAMLILNFKMSSNIVVMNLKMGTTFLALAVILRMLAVSSMPNGRK